MNTPSTQAFNLWENGRKRIYLDHNATTPIATHLPSFLTPLLEQWGNASSIHQHGRGPKLIIREARQQIAALVGASPLELIFTAGGSESNNLAIKGFFETLVREHGLDPSTWPRNEFITTTVEHPSVTKTFHWLRDHGAVVHFINVSREGQLDQAAFDAALSEKTALVSIMTANNETGTLFPIKELCFKAHTLGARFHTDGVQMLGKLPLNVKDLGVDYASFAAHKFYSLKGCGALFVKKGAPLESIIHGGRQERARRAGTENTLAIASFGEIAKRADDIETRAKAMAELRDSFESQILSDLRGVKVTAGSAPRLPNTSSLVIENIDGESLLMNLDIQGVSVSTGAACSSGNPEPSPVLLAMGLSRLEAQASLRVSLGWETTPEEMNYFTKVLIETVTRLRALRDEYAASHSGQESR